MKNKLTIRFNSDVDFIEYYKENYKKSHKSIGWSYSFDEKEDFAYCIGDYKNCNKCNNNMNIKGTKYDIRTCSKVITSNDAKIIIRIKKLNSI